MRLTCSTPLVVRQGSYRFVAIGFRHARTVAEERTKQTNKVCKVTTINGRKVGESHYAGQGIRCTFRREAGVVAK